MKDKGLPVEIIGDGVMRVKTSDIFKNEKALAQIRALKYIKMGRR